VESLLHAYPILRLSRVMPPIFPIGIHPSMVPEDYNGAGSKAAPNNELQNAQARLMSGESLTLVRVTSHRQRQRLFTALGRRLLSLRNGDPFAPGEFYLLTTQEMVAASSIRPPPGKARRPQKGLSICWASEDARGLEESKQRLQEFENGLDIAPSA
jgi:hypothetical protein